MGTSYVCRRLKALCFRLAAQNKDFLSNFGTKQACSITPLLSYCFYIDTAFSNSSHITCIRWGPRPHLCQNVVVRVLCGFRRLHLRRNNRCNIFLACNESIPEKQPAWSRHRVGLCVRCAPECILPALSHPALFPIVLLRLAGASVGAVFVKTARQHVLATRLQLLYLHYVLRI